MNRLAELLCDKNAFLLDNELIIYTLNREMTIRYNDGDKLVEISGEIDGLLSNYIEDKFK